MHDDEHLWQTAMSTVHIPFNINSLCISIPVWKLAAIIEMGVEGTNKHIRHCLVQDVQRVVESLLM